MSISLEEFKKSIQMLNPAMLSERLFYHEKLTRGAAEWGALVGNVKAGQQLAELAERKAKRLLPSSIYSYDGLLDILSYEIRSRLAGGKLVDSVAMEIEQISSIDDLWLVMTQKR